MNLRQVSKDERGEIYILTKEGELCNILITKAGKARGGCIHKVDEHLIVLKGEIELFLYNQGKIFKEGECVTIPSTTPHYFKSIIDSVVSESGAKGEILGKYEPHLDEINKINSTE
ncbi:MAG TPA: cupin domain-containing protein [bacterium]|nr:cupin domain-containing protein [bacterium]